MAIDPTSGDTTGSETITLCIRHSIYSIRESMFKVVNDAIDWKLMSRECQLATMLEF